MSSNPDTSERHLPPVPANLYVNLNDLHPIKQQHEAHSSIIGAALPVFIDAEIPDSLFEIEDEDEDGGNHATLAEGSVARHYERISRGHVTMAESPVLRHHERLPWDHVTLAMGFVGRHHERLPWGHVTLAESPMAKQHDRLSWDHAMPYGIDANKSTASGPPIQITQHVAIEYQMDTNRPHEATHRVKPTIEHSASQSFGLLAEPLARYRSSYHGHDTSIDGFPRASSGAVKNITSDAHQFIRSGAKIPSFWYGNHGGVSCVGHDTLLEPGMHEFDSGGAAAIPCPVGSRLYLGSCHEEVVGYQMDGDLAAYLMSVNPTHGETDAFGRNLDFDQGSSPCPQKNQSPLFHFPSLSGEAQSLKSQHTSPSTDHGHTAKDSRDSTSPTTSICSKNSVHCSFPRCLKPLFDRSTQLRHERDVHGLHGGDDFEWWCPICMRSFKKRKDNCLKHIRRYHAGGAGQILPLKVWKPSVLSHILRPMFKVLRNVAFTHTSIFPQSFLFTAWVLLIISTFS
jgi:hypothetical protein